MSDEEIAMIGQLKSLGTPLSCRSDAKKSQKNIPKNTKPIIIYPITPIVRISRKYFKRF